MLHSQHIETGTHVHASLPLPLPFQKTSIPLDGDVTVLNPWWDKEHSSCGHFQQKSSHTSYTRRKHTDTPSSCAEIFLCLSSYCRATHELQNGGWTLGIGPSKPKCPTFFMRHSLWVLANSMHKTVHCSAHECLWVIGLEQNESRRVTLSPSLCPES